MRTNAILLLSAVLLSSTSVFAGNFESIPDDQWKTAKDVVSFQLFAETTGPVMYMNTKRAVTLTNLNKNINSWFLLEVVPEQKQAVATRGSTTAPKPRVYNLENASPDLQQIGLSADGKVTVTANGTTATCEMLGEDGASGPLYKAFGTDPYVSVCDGKLYLRNQMSGHKDTVAWGAGVLRDVLGEAGDDLVNKAKESWYDGSFFEGGEEKAGGGQGNTNGPAPAIMSADTSIASSGIGFDLQEDVSNGMSVGQWYAAKNFPGVYLSVSKAKYVPEDILNTYGDRVKKLDAAGQGETEAVVNSIAMDLEIYSFGWNDGTEHPGVGWSSRAKNPSGPGPDGFDSLAPLAFPGVVSPTSLLKTVGVMTGGFQRRHSAFKAGPLADINKGSHYGFMEKGVLMSTMVPNLATFIVYKDGSMDLKTWTLADNANLSKMRDVRQNGVALIETDPATGNGIPGEFVNQWGPGNWSGSADKDLKTPRTSACLIENNGKRYLMFSYFSTHTPNSMARVLQSYGCKYAIHLDMNTPQYAYTAFFTPTADGDYKIEHLDNAMADDVVVNGKKAPRSLLTPTYKDFFYIMHR